MKTGRTLQELFSFPGFRAKQNLRGIFGEPKARIVELIREKKLQYAQGVEKHIALTSVPLVNW